MDPCCELNCDKLFDQLTLIAPTLSAPTYRQVIRKSLNISQALTTDFKKWVSWFSFVSVIRRQALRVFLCSRLVPANGQPSRVYIVTFFSLSFTTDWMKKILTNGLYLLVNRKKLIEISPGNKLKYSNWGNLARWLVESYIVDESI